MPREAKIEVCEECAGTGEDCPVCFGTGLVPVKPHPSPYGTTFLQEESYPWLVAVIKEIVEITGGQIGETSASRYASFILERLVEGNRDTA